MMFEFKVRLIDGSRYVKTVIAETYTQAKYQVFQDLKMEWYELTYSKFLKIVRCTKVGIASPASLYTDPVEFQRMCEHRNLHFAYQGMKIAVREQIGTVIGNYGMNLLVLFDGSWNPENCHPWWETCYFGATGEPVKDYRKEPLCSA